MAGSRARTWAAAGLAALLGLAGWGLSRTPETVPRDRLLTGIPSGPVVVLGTSLSHSAAWPEAMAETLPACAGPVIRITRPGAHAGWGLAQVPRVIAEDPGLVLIEFAVNDADIRDGLSRATARATTREIVERLRAGAPRARLALMTMSPARGLRRLTRPLLARHYAQYHDLAEALDVGLIDLYPRWRGTGRIADGLHPDDADFAAAALPAVRDWMAAAYGGACAG